MNYSGSYSNDTLNGKGFRVSLFVSGCGKVPKCKHCQNKEAWNFTYGKEFTKEIHEKIISDLKPNYIKGISLLGGEIFDNLQEDTLFNLMDDIKQIYYKSKDVWCWTGYLYNDLIKDSRKKDFMKYIDVLIDGEFDITKKNLNNPFRNSENQRIIDVQASLKQDKVILYDL